ncbi:MAG TPA: phytanoyl-CoA dioxygenase family protein [Acidimicrobiia bacterium]|nr:phytanoyl-CoA dioxygenase family protein [Acidimicrobiia bacterium]
MLALTTQEIARFHREGFLVVERPLVSPDDLVMVRQLLDDLFDRFDTLPTELAYDLGDVQHHHGPQQIPEINDARKLEPRLATTTAFARCRDLARQLLSDRAYCTFDHAICKPPHNDTAIEWHQDLATSPHLAGCNAVHVWLALQDVTEANGCMHFIPHDERLGLLPHRRRSASAHALVAEGVDSSTAVACPLGAGMATVHKLTTLHYTSPNTTDQPRLAWITHFREAPRPRGVHRARVALSRLRQTIGRGLVRSEARRNSA